MAHPLYRGSILRQFLPSTNPPLYAFSALSRSRHAIRCRKISANSTPPPISAPKASPTPNLGATNPQPVSKPATTETSMFAAMTPAGNRLTSIFGAVALALSLPLVWNGVHGWYLTLSNRADEIRDDRSPAGILLDALMWPYEAAKRLDWGDGKGTGK